MILYVSNVKRKWEYESVAQNPITSTDDPPPPAKKWKHWAKVCVFYHNYHFSQAVMTIVIPMLVNFSIYAHCTRKGIILTHFVINVFVKPLMLSIFHDITDLPSPH